MKKVYIIVLVIIFIILTLVSSFFIFKKELYVSFGNSDSSAKIIKTRLNEEQIIEKYKNYEYLKIDEIVSIKKIRYEEFINNYHDFIYGIGIDNNRIILLPEEVKVNNIYDVEKNNINFENLNSYLQKKV